MVGKEDILDDIKGLKPLLSIIIFEIKSCLLLLIYNYCLCNDF